MSSGSSLSSPLPDAGVRCSADRAQLAPVVDGNVPEAGEETGGWVTMSSLQWVHGALARNREVMRTLLLPTHGVPVLPKTPFPPQSSPRTLQGVKDGRVRGQGRR